jgi:hypothetical protein
MPPSLANELKLPRATQPRRMVMQFRPLIFLRHSICMGGTPRVALAAATGQ